MSTTWTHPPTSPFYAIAATSKLSIILRGWDLTSSSVELCSIRPCCRVH